jgi:hypothetical protein
MDETLLRGDDAGPTVRFTGTARHGRFRPDGTTSVGVKFTSVHPQSRMRLIAYLETIAAQAEVEQAA